MYKQFAVAVGAAVFLVSSAAGVFAYDRHVMVINNSSYGIVEFYASSVGVNTWQEDILGEDVLPSGSQVNVNVDDGTGYCKYDFKAVFDDGTSTESRGINVCEIPTFTYHD